MNRIEEFKSHFRDPGSAKERSRNKEYRTACKTAKIGNTKEMREAIAVFSKMLDYRDAAERKRECESFLALAEKAEAEKAERAKKRAAAQIRNSLIAFVTIVLILVATMLLFVASKNAAYDVDDIDVTISDIRAEYDDKYYVYFDMTIENGTKTDVRNLYFELRITDKDGNTVGTIDTTLERIDLEAGKDMDKSLYLSNSRLSADGVLAALYENPNADDYEFEIVITRVSFADGESYYLED